MIRVRIQKKSKSGKGSRSSGSAYVGGYASREYSGTVAEAVHAQHAGELDAGSKTRSELLEAAAGYTDARKAEVLESVANDYLSKEAAAEGYVSKTKDDTVGGVLTFIKGLMSKALSVFEKGLQIGANFISGTKNSGAQIDERGNGELESLIIRSLMQSSGFIGGFGGQGVRIYQDGNGEWNIESDTLTVRGTLRVYELLIDRLRAVGGQVVVSKANGKVKAVEIVDYINGAEEQPEEVVEEIVGGDGIATYKKALSAGAGDIEPEPVEEEPVEVETYYKMSFEDECPFVMGDLIRCQKFTGKSLKHYWVKVVTVVRGYAYVSTSDDGLYSGIPAAGDEVVLCGNVTDTTRQAAILISAAQEATGEPIISVLSGINSRSFAGCLRTRLGYLGDIRDNDLGGQLSGYGLYGENVFLKGTFLLKSGNTYVEVGKSITAAVNNLEVGGRNLLLNADFSNENFKLYYGWNYIYNTVEHITTDLPQGFSSGVQFVAEWGGYGVYTKGDIVPKQTCYPLQAGQHYTLSFYGRVTSGTPVENNFYYGLENVITNIVSLTSEWKRFSMTFTPTQAQVGEALVFYSQTAGNYAITGLKLERGDKATDWTPSTEDTEAKIEVLSNQINLSVKKDELETVGIHLDGNNSYIHAVANKTDFYGTDGKPYISFGVKDGIPYLIFYDSDGIERYNLGYTGLTQIIQSSSPQSWGRIGLLGTFAYSEVCNASDIWNDYSGSQIAKNRRTYYVYNEAYTLDAQGRKIWAHGGVYDRKVYDSSGLDRNQLPTGNLVTEAWFFGEAEKNALDTVRNYVLYLIDETLQETRSVVLERQTEQQGTIYYAYYKDDTSIVSTTITIPSQPE